jgi:hypothetical protein
VTHYLTEYQLSYTDVDGRFARFFLPMFVGAFAAGGLWFLYLLVVYPPSAPLATAAIGLVLIVITWLSSRLALRLAVLSWRSGRGEWWLRLSSSGFQVNDRILRPRHHEWRDIEKFMLVAPTAEIERAVVAPAISFTEALTDGVQLPAFRVGFALSTRHRRSLSRRLFADFSGRDGTRADGTVMGYWDRPFDEAVDLMNEWRSRYPAGR